MKTVLGVLLGIIGFVVFVAVILGIWGVTTYNHVITLGQNVDKSWADVQSVYQRRADLIPNLVKTVEGAANFEKNTLTEVIQARQQVNNVQVNPNDPQSFQKFQQSQDALSGALSRLLVVVERYPELKANANFRDLQTQIEGTENRIAVERRNFNEAVRQFNATVQSFPLVLFASNPKFAVRPYFQAAAGTENAPAVNFNFGNSKATPSN